MVGQVTKSTQDNQVISKEINVTTLTPKEKKRIIANHLEQAGFIGLVKKKIGKQTYYTFIYKN